MECCPCELLSRFMLVNTLYKSHVHIAQCKMMELMVNCLDFGYTTALTTETRAGTVVGEGLAVFQARARVLYWMHYATHKLELEKLNRKLTRLPKSAKDCRTCFFEKPLYLLRTASGHVLCKLKMLGSKCVSKTIRGLYGISIVSHQLRPFSTICPKIPGGILSLKRTFIARC